MPAFESDTRGSQEEGTAQEDGKCLWSSLLKEVTHKASVKLPSTRALIVLGDDGCGKTTLITRLQGTEDPKTSYGLEYTFIDIKDEDRDDQTKLNVWILDGDVVHSHLLKFALNADNFGECVVVIMVSMAEPWNIVESLEKWTDILSKHIKRLSIPPETLTDYKNGLVQQFREYIEPDSLLAPATPAPITHAPLATAPTAVRRVTQALHPATAALLSSTLAPPTANTAAAATADAADAADKIGETEGSLTSAMQLPLDATTLSENLGIPLVVVVTKTDAMKTLEKEDRFTEEHFDFIQMHIRRFCLTYGAALFYVSVKEDKNCDLLNRYLQSRIYGFPFTQTAYVVERDCVFVPTGWDSEKKISILEENFAQIRSSDPYNDVIPRPPPRKPAVRDPELVAQDEQSFLTRLIAIMQRDANQPGAGSAGSANVGSGAAASAGSSEAILEQLATAAQLTSGSVGSSQSGAGVPRTSMGSPRTPQSGVRAKPSPGSAGSTTVGSGGAGGGARTSEGVLANFFTSLLNKRSNVAGAPVVAPPAVSSNTDKMSPKDLQSELERLARSSREQLEANKQVSKQSVPEADQSATADAAEVETKPAAATTTTTGDEGNASAQPAATEQVAENLSKSPKELVPEPQSVEKTSVKKTDTKESGKQTNSKVTAPVSSSKPDPGDGGALSKPKAPVASQSAKVPSPTGTAAPSTEKQSSETAPHPKNPTPKVATVNAASPAGVTATTKPTEEKIPAKEQLAKTTGENPVQVSETAKQAAPEVAKAASAAPCKAETGGSGAGAAVSGDASSKPKPVPSQPATQAAPSKTPTAPVGKTTPVATKQPTDKEAIKTSAAKTNNPVVVKPTEVKAAGKPPAKESVAANTAVNAAPKDSPSKPESSKGSSCEQTKVSDTAKQAAPNVAKAASAAPCKAETGGNGAGAAVSGDAPSKPKPASSQPATQAAPAKTPAASVGKTTPVAAKQPADKDAMKISATKTNTPVAVKSAEVKTAQKSPTQASPVSKTTVEPPVNPSASSK